MHALQTCKKKKHVCEQERDAHLAKWIKRAPVTEPLPPSPWPALTQFTMSMWMWEEGVSGRQVTTGRWIVNLRKDHCWTLGNCRVGQLLEEEHRYCKEQHLKSPSLLHTQKSLLSEDKPKHILSRHMKLSGKLLHATVREGQKQAGRWWD